MTIRSSFEELLEKDWSVTINLPWQSYFLILYFAIETYNISNGLSPTFMVKLMNEIDIAYHSWSSCQIKFDIGGKIVDLKIEFSM